MNWLILLCFVNCMVLAIKLRWGEPIDEETTDHDIDTVLNNDLEGGGLTDDDLEYLIANKNRIIFMNFIWMLFGFIKLYLIWSRYRK